MVASGARVAVEVELSHKSPRRLAAILAGYARGGRPGDLRGGLIYVSDRADVLDAVRRAAERAGLPERRFRTRELADVQAEVRRLTTAARERANASPAPRRRIRRIRATHRSLSSARSVQRR